MAKRIRKQRRKRSRGDRPQPDRQPERSAEEEARRGTVVTLFSGSCRIESAGCLLDGVLSSRLARRQRAAVAVGDEVLFVSRDGGHRVTEVLPRRTWLSRPDPQNPRLEQVVAANVDVVVQVLSVVKPPLRPALVDRYLIAIERGGAEPLLCVNKIDLMESAELAVELEKLDVYRAVGLAMASCSASTGAGIDDLRAVLAGRTAAFVGHSGVGKSSLLKALAPQLEVATGAVSRRYARGRHTTSRARLYRLTDGIRVIDTPGVRELGLWRMNPEELRFYFQDFEDDARRCRFNDCTHTHEPDCAVRAAVDEGRLAEARYATYLRILSSLKDLPAG